MPLRLRVRMARPSSPPGPSVPDVEWVASDDGDVDVVVLDARAYASAEEVRAVRESLSGPVLFRVARELAAEVMGALHPEDELSVEGEPDEVLVHRLRKLAGPRDELTGLSTRTTLTRELDRALASASDASPVSVILIDIDHFKRLNDEHGHGRGDEVLAEIGARLRALSDDAPCVARTGGEVFTILHVGGESSALARAEALLGTIREKPIAGLAITASAGVATANGVVGPRALLRDADEALYRAKARGRDRAISAEALRRESVEEGTDADLESFEDFTRVIAERVADIISRRGRRMFTELKMQADIDALTHLYSRRYLDRRLPFELAQAARNGADLTVAMLDLDHFGEVNKEHGWPTGDRVLTEIAELVRGCVRGTDWVARYGGEEICIVLVDTRLREARPVLERVRRAVEAHTIESTRSVPVHITVSIGAAELARDDTALTLVDRASSALLEAKNGGRNSLCAPD